MLSLEQNALLGALRASIAHQKFNIPKNVDVQLLFKESMAQAVSLFCLQGINADTLNELVKSNWQSYSMYSLKSNASIHSQHTYLHALMQEAKIPYVILKGSVSAFYYSDPMLRAMGDVDFLVKEEDVERAGKFLVSKGFICEEEKHVCHIVYKKGKVHLEMHFAPPGMPEGQAGDMMKEYLSDIFVNSELVEFSGNKFVKPNDFHHGLILLMHTYHHLLSEGIGLRHLCDWAMFVNSFRDEQFAEIYKTKLLDVGLWKFTQILSYISYKYLGIEQKEWMEKQDENLCQAVIEDIFLGGNFGRKDDKRLTQGLTISNRGKDGFNKSKIAQFFSSLNKAGQVRYPKMAKIPVIKYFCIIPIGFRYVFRVITGKRKRLKIFGSMKQAEKRKQLYKQLGLFEVDDKETTKKV